MAGSVILGFKCPLTVFLSYRFIHPFKCFELRSFKQSLFSWYRLKNFHKNAINALERCV